MIIEDKYSTVVLVTDSFPFGGSTEASFVVPEIEALSRKFDKVYVVPTISVGDRQPFECPDNVTVDTFWLDDPNWQSRWLRARFAMSRDFLHLTATDRSRRSIAFVLASIAFSKSIDRWIDRIALDRSRTLFYTFWFDLATAGLALLNRHSPLHIVSRAHRHDLYCTDAHVLRELSIASCKNVFCVSDAGAQWLRNKFPTVAEKIVMARLGCKKLYPGLSVANDPGSKRLSFLSIARVSSEKRVDLNYKMLRALAIARPSTDFYWTHVGDGDLMDSLRDLVKHDCPANLHVDLRGAMANNAVQRLFIDSRVDWTMLLSEIEGLPVCVCESLAYGVPVVATMVDGTDEAVDDDCGVLLAPDPQPEEFVRGMLPYIDSRARYDRLREGAVSKYNDNFEAGRLRREFVDLIASL